MVTRTLAPLLIALAVLNGCGGGDDAEAKQAALAPAPSAATQAVDADEPAATSAPAPAPAPATKPAAPAESAAVVAVTAPPADSAPAAPPEEGIAGRESFSYTGGSRDPFASLLKAARLGPELPDLTLVAIYYDTRSPNNSVVVMREKVGARKYNLRPGDRLGRLRVTSVRPKDVTFTIDDFGTERQETVSLRKQEDVQ